MNHRGRRIASGGLVVVVLAIVGAAFAVRGFDRATSAAATHGTLSAKMSMSGSMGSMGGSKQAKLLAKWGITPVAMAHMEQPTRAAWIPFAPALAAAWLERVSATTAAAGPSRRARCSARGRRPTGRALAWAGVRPSGDDHDQARRRPSWYRDQVRPARRALGEIGLFSVSVSSDGKHFGPAVAYGRWQPNATVKQVVWTARSVKAVRLTIKSTSRRARRVGRGLEARAHRSPRRHAQRAGAQAGVPRPPARRSSGNGGRRSAFR